jgi:UDP-N-acetylmuramyl pentapeptide phosphotransferase/UDP-N-acetylglucosamine-1-phosphate transferase
VILIAALIAFAVSALSMVGLLPVLRRIGAMDTPNHRSSHTVVTPRGGGLALLLGMACGAMSEAVNGHHSFSSFDAGLVVIVAVLGVVGLIDDVSGVRTLVRLSIQILCGVMMDVISFDGSWRPVWQLTLFGIVGVVWLASYVNAFNFMDGINGISGMSAIVAGLWYAYTGDRYNDPSVTMWGLLLAASALGFLLWNVPRAHVFLGDVGSYAIGATIAYLAWSVSIGHERPVVGLAPLAIYLADTAFTLGRRILAGSPLTEAHREHIYQRLVDGGMSHVTATGLVLAFTAVVCALVRYLPTSLALVLAVLVLALYLASPRLAGRLFP